MPAFLAKHIKLLASLCASLVLFSSLSSLTHAQQPVEDLQAPSMEHDPLEFSAADPVQIFTAIVSDNTSLKSVRLFHRYKGENDYIAENMESIADSTIYSAKIIVKEDPLPTIEYYLQAEDEAGNVVLNGYAFAPLERDMSSAPAVWATADSQPSPTTTEKPKSKVLYYVLGALAVGAVAAAAAGGGSSDGGGAEDVCGSAGCPVTFTVGTP